MKLLNALLGVVFSFCALSAQNQTLDSIAVSTNYLDEVVVTDSRFALKRSQSGKTVVKIKQEEIEQFLKIMTKIKTLKFKLDTSVNVQGTQSSDTRKNKHCLSLKKQSS